MNPQNELNTSSRMDLAQINNNIKILSIISFSNAIAVYLMFFYKANSDVSQLHKLKGLNLNPYFDAKHERGFK